MNVKLKLFLQQGFCLPMCCAFDTGRTTDGRPLFTNQEKNIRGINELLRELRECRAGQVEVSVVNSWGFKSLWEVMRLGIKPHEPTWVLGGRKIYEGVPSLSELLAAIDAELQP
jgi:hypothetical protein